MAADPSDYEIAQPLLLYWTMYILLLTLTLLAGLTLARRIAEPACPACESKSWNDHPSHLQCARCGWSNAATASLGRGEAVAAAGPQYEISLSL